MKNLFKNKKGLTLMEVIVALGVVVTGVVGGLVLTSYNINVATTSENRLTAVNLAREGIEVVRNLRDSNWLAGNSWNQGILSTGYRFIVDFDEATASWSVVEQAVDIDDCVACQLYLDSATDVYSHDAADSLTPYKRLISVKEICWRNIVESEVIADYGNDCTSVLQGELVGWQISSKVKWEEPGRSQEVEVIEKIYDWK